MSTKKGGRRKTQVLGFDGKAVAELSYDKGSKSYYHLHNDQGKWKKLNLGRDKPTAIFKLNQWLKAHQQESYGSVDRTKVKPATKIILDDRAAPKKNDETAEEFKKRLTEFGLAVRKGQTSSTLTPVTLIPDSYVYARARYLILADKIEAAKQMGIPEIAYFDTIKCQPAATLDEIGKAYLARPEFKVKMTEGQKLEKYKVDETWKRFCKVVGVERVDELSKDIISKYYTEIFQEYKSRKLSTVWIRGYFERVIRVLNYAVKHFDNASIITEAKLRCTSLLRKPKSEVKNLPKKIAREEFLKLLEVSNVEEKCMWLLSMNCAYYTEDIITLPVSAINLNDKAIIFRRGKTKEHRAAILWDITIDAMHEYQKHYPHSGETFFINQQTKAPYNKTTISAKFRSVKKRAKIKSTICHQNFRDSTPSICSEAKIYTASIDAVMGHRLQGENVKYNDPEIYPRLSEDACKAVYDFYFADKPKTSGANVSK